MQKGLAQAALLGRKPLQDGWGCVGERVAGGALCLVTPPRPSSQEEYEKLDLIHKEEKVQLEELKQKCDVLVQEFSQIRAKREVNAKKRTEAEQEMLRMVRAATLIQALWRGYLVRSMLKSRKKKRSKSKGRIKEKSKAKAKAKGKAKK